jgi:hypothetical protein
MRIMLTRMQRALVSAMAVGFTMTAQAAIVTLDGNGFIAKYDDTQSGLSLYGTPTLSGDGKTILFTPTTFSALSSGTQGLVTTTGTVVFDIFADNGLKVSTLQVFEAGDYQVIRQNGANPAPAVNIFGEARITNLFNGTATAIGSLAPSNLGVVCVTLACSATDWTASANVLTPAGWNQSSGTRFLLQNTLQAQSFAVGDSAFIQKKQSSTTIGITVDTTPVPLPATLPLLLSGLGAMGAVGRRRRSKRVS